MRWLRLSALLVAALITTLGALWLGQGVGLVRIEPIACVGECRPLEGPSVVWAALGAATFIAGAAGVVVSLRRPGWRGSAGG